MPVDAVGISWEEWLEQQRERIFAEARSKRHAAPSGPPALEQPPMLQELTLSPRSAVQAALPIQDVVRA
ncbi:MAG: hypothetical protein JO159_14520 [Acidobacteria bacterium]|nr:hypothetical protein [Acidobacteriota bacterium]